jgi:hypothetical protein
MSNKDEDYDEEEDDFDYQPSEEEDDLEAPSPKSKSASKRKQKQTSKKISEKKAGKKPLINENDDDGDSDKFDELYLPDEELEALKMKEQQKWKGKDRAIAYQKEPVDLATIFNSEPNQAVEEEEDEDDDDEFAPMEDEEEDENIINEEEIDNLDHISIQEEAYMLYNDMTKSVTDVIHSMKHQASSSSAVGSSSSSGSTSMATASSSTSSSSTSSSSNESEISSGAATTKRKIEEVDDFFNNMQKVSDNNLAKRMKIDVQKEKQKEEIESQTVTQQQIKSKTTDSIDDFFEEMHKSSLNISSKSVLKGHVSPVSTEPVQASSQKDDRLDSLIEKLQKKKVTTIKKSKEDWEKFKVEKGLEEELRHATKDGYLEKQAFLERADIRQWERERDLRNQERERQRWAQENK